MNLKTFIILLIFVIEFLMIKPEMIPFVCWKDSFFKLIALKTFHLCFSKKFSNVSLTLIEGHQTGKRLQNKGLPDTNKKTFAKIIKKFWW